MFDIVSYISVAGKQYNEDAIYVPDRDKNQCLVVVDGATSLEKSTINGYSSDAEWLALNLIGSFPKNLENCNNNFSAALAYTSFELYNKLQIIGKGNVKPTASLLCAVDLGENIAIATLGDASALIKDKHGKVQRLHDNTLTLLDNTVIARMKELSNTKGISIKNARDMQEIQDMLLEHRHLANKTNGYRTFMPSQNDLSWSNIYYIPTNDIEYIALMTDGFYAAVDCYEITNSNNELMSMLINGIAPEIIEEIRKRAYSDTKYDKYPRFKIMDDASVVVAKVN